MDFKEQISHALHDMAESGIPSEQVDLWPALRTSLVAGAKSKPQQGARMNGFYGRKMLTTALAVIAILATAIATPQGRAFAEEMLALFTRAQGRQMPLPLGQVLQPREGAPTTPAPAPLMALAEAQSRAGFQAAQFASAPDGLEFLGARLYGNAISLEYQVPGAQGNLILLQSREGYYQSDWDQVPAEAIQSVSVLGLAAEFAEGTFVAPPGQIQATWNPDAPILRLRWMKDGTYYELTRFGENGVLAGLDRRAMLSLAESLEYPMP